MLPSGFRHNQVGEKLRERIHFDNQLEKNKSHFSQKCYKMGKILLKAVDVSN